MSELMLVQVLETTKLDVAPVLSLLDLETRAPNGSKGEEARDHLLGRVFGLLAIISSRLPFTSKDGCTQCTSMAEMLLDLYWSKSWLRPSVGLVMVQLIDSLQHISTSTSWREEVIQAIIKVLFASRGAWTPERVCWQLRARSYDWDPVDGWDPLLSPRFENVDILHTKNLAVLAEIIKVCTSVRH